jgi:hypothetical protein
VFLNIIFVLDFDLMHVREWVDNVIVLQVHSVASCFSQVQTRWLRIIMHWCWITVSRPDAASWWASVSIACIKGATKIATTCEDHSFTKVANDCLITWHSHPIIGSNRLYSTAEVLSLIFSFKIMSVSCCYEYSIYKLFYFNYSLFISLSSITLSIQIVNTDYLFRIHAIDFIWT